jgi:hypothetical protein
MKKWKGHGRNISAIGRAARRKTVKMLKKRGNYLKAKGAGDLRDGFEEAKCSS